MLVMVVDGQGGGIGRALIEGLCEKLPSNCELIALGTNSIATAAMKKAGASAAATGENAIIFNAARADVIAGSIGIIAANSIMGELSPAMACAISSSPAMKVLIPMNKCNLQVAGLPAKALPERVDSAINIILEHLRNVPTL